MTYEQTLRNYGIPPEQVARDLHADALQFFRNREHAAYGKAQNDDKEQDHE